MTTTVKDIQEFLEYLKTQMEYQLLAGQAGITPDKFVEANPESARTLYQRFLEHRPAAAAAQGTAQLEASMREVERVANGQPSLREGRQQLGALLGIDESAMTDQMMRQYDNLTPEQVAAVQADKQAKKQASEAESQRAAEISAMCQAVMFIGQLQGMGVALSFDSNQADRLTAAGWNTDQIGALVDAVANQTVPGIGYEGRLAALQVLNDVLLTIIQANEG